VQRETTFLVSGCRTPIGKFQGGLASLAAPQLGAIVVAEAVRRAGLAPEQIDEVILGCVLSAGLGQAPARQAALRAGLPPTVAALTINKMCGSGLKAVMLADQAIRAGDAVRSWPAGMENMSRAPYLLAGAREGWKFGHQQVVDSMIHDGLWCACENLSMGAEADYIAHLRGVSREDQDRWAVESHRRAADSIASGRFDAEIVPVTIPSKKGETVVRHDEGPRAETTLSTLAGLRPSFRIAGAGRGPERHGRQRFAVERRSRSFGCRR